MRVSEAGKGQNPFNQINADGEKKSKIENTPKRKSP